MDMGRKSRVMVPLILVLIFPKETSQVIEVQEITVLGSVRAVSNKR